MKMFNYNTCITYSTLRAYLLFIFGHNVFEKEGVSSKFEQKLVSESTSWTWKQNKQFEDALVVYDKGTRDHWDKVASMVDKKPLEEVKTHYNILIEDIERNDVDMVPILNYKSLNWKNQRNFGTRSEYEKEKGNTKRCMIHTSHSITRKKWW